jgi:transposase
MNAKEGSSLKHFTSEQKSAAVELFKARVPLKKIRNQLNMSERTLRRILSHAKSHPESPIISRKPGSGRPTTFTPAVKEKMKNMLRKNPCITGGQLKGRIPELANSSIRRIQEVCKDDLGYPSRRMAKKPPLTQRMLEQRLAFAMEYRHWTLEDWKKVMMSDESHFELHLGGRHTRCRRPRGSDRFDPRFTQKKVKHPQKVMVWGCFSWKGSGKMELLKQGEMMNSQRYLQLLESRLELFMQQHGTTHFLQDGAPCHKAKIVMKWFQDRPHITLIKWPGNSPDLNPIENVWSWMKNQLASKNCKNMDEWITEIKRLWYKKMKDVQYLKDLVEGMPRRLEEVIERQGGISKY